MAKWTLETSEAAASQPVTGFGGPYIQPPVNISPGLPMINPPAPQGETATAWTGTRPVLLPAPVTQENGCKSGCGVAYPGSSPATAVPASSTVRAADTINNALAGFKDWPWWVWLVIALVVLLLVRK